jgi:L-arabinose isomerase
MLDMYSDFTMVSAETGAHVEVLEMCDLDRSVQNVSETEIRERIELAQQIFRFENVDEGALEWGARVAAGLDRLVAEYALDGLTYYYRGVDGNQYERLGAGLILGNSLLTARGIPASGEGDLKTCIAMMILDRLGAGGSFTEFYAMDFRESLVLMGHDGPAHLAIAEGKPVLRSLGLYHGKRGYGASVEFSIRCGPVTLLAVTQTVEGRLKMITAEGESIPGAILKIGNTNSRLRFSLPPAAFVNRWCEEAPTHHCALGTGHVNGVLDKVAQLMSVPVVKVC